MAPYLVHIQYLGFRFSGWQRQPGVKTIESMVAKTLEFILGHKQFRILGSSRTDAMVSAGQAAFALFLDPEISPEDLLASLNQNFPPDIRATGVEVPGPDFNIINSARIKEYLYLFSHGHKAHPFCAPLLASFADSLDIHLMARGAGLFQGVHDFARYCTKPRPGTKTVREIRSSRIVENRFYTASFFPDQTWAFQVRAKGFMRHQVRLMMGQLIALGRGQITLADITDSLDGKGQGPLKTIAPASGLMLHKIEFEQIQT